MVEAKRTVQSASVQDVIGPVKNTTHVWDQLSEDAFWAEHYRTRFYYDESVPYDQYRPAYRYGWEARARHPRCAFEAIEAELKANWQASRAPSKLEWEKAREAIRDAWDLMNRKRFGRVTA
jgi:hypothetical protein